ncbi:TPA: hypothetical protein ACOED5_002735 [Enterobacter kobei]
MSTITREFTKEQLIKQAKKNIEVLRGAVEKIPGASDAAVIHLKLAEITLASLDAEAVAFVMADDLKDSSIISTPAYRDLGEAMERTIGDVVALYTAPPAPANAEPVAWLWSNRKHPSEVTLVRPEDDERAEGAHWSGWSCQALYAEPQAPVSVPDDYFSSLVAAARVRADKAMRKFPQPNYVLNKVAEESGEVIKAVIHFTEGREEWRNVEGEIIDNLAMLIRLVMEGDQVIGFTPPDACRSAMLQSFGNSEQLNSPGVPDCSCRTCRPVTFTDSRFVVCPECGNKRCPHANDHRNACTGSNEPGQEGSAYPAAPQQEVK